MLPTAFDMPNSNADYSIPPRVVYVSRGCKDFFSKLLFQTNIGYSPANAKLKTSGRNT